jgi:hypothetical protein
MRDRRIKRAVAAVTACTLFLTTAGPVLAFDSAPVRSLVLPGAGQAHKGHYTRAALFASAAIISGAGLFASQIHYNRAVDSLNDQKRIYNDYPRLLEAGNVFSQQEIDATYAAMLQAEDDADSRVKWRNAFLGALIVTYTLNLVDVIMSEPDTGEIENSSGLSVEMQGDDVRIVKSFSF